LDNYLSPPNSLPSVEASAVPARRTSQGDDFGHIEAHFVFDDFEQGNVRGAEISDVRDERQAGAAAAKNLAGGHAVTHVDQDVRVKEPSPSFLTRSAFHVFS